MLEIRDLRAGYGQGDVLKGVTFSVAPDELIVLLGANGAGKTTLLKTISGMLRPSSGSVTFDGEDITDHPPYLICRQGLIHIPEGRRLFPSMTVEENLILGAMPGPAMERSAETLAEVYELFPVLAERRKQLAGTLSGGEQQQVAMGRGLMSRPRLLMLDEPTLGLAPVLSEGIFEIVRRLSEEQGIPILVVSQDVLEALNLAPRAIVLENGVVALEGASKELLKDDQVRKAYLGL